MSDEEKRGPGPTDVEESFFREERSSGGFSRYEETDRIMRAPRGPAVNAESTPEVGIDVDMDETRPFTPEDRGLVPGAASSTAASSGAPSTAEPAAGDEGAPSSEAEAAGAPRSTKPATPRASALPIVPPVPPKPAEPPPADEAQAWRARIEGLVKEARARTGDATAAPLWFEAGRIFETELKNLRDAATHYQEAHKADPGFLPVVHAARRLFAQLGKWPMVVVLIDEELKLEGAPRAPLLLEKGRIHETKLARVDDAVTLYRDALLADPAYAPAVDALSRHLVARQAWSDLDEVLSQAAASTTDERQKLEWLLERARIEEAQLKDEPRAIRTYETARAIDPSSRVPLDALRRLYARTASEDPLIDVLGALAEVATAGGEVVSLSLEEARLKGKRGDAAGALRALQRARHRAPADTVVLGELARIAEAAEDWPALVDVLVSLVQHTHDASERVALHADAGRIAEARLKDVDQAIAHYRACILIDPAYQPAISALGRVFARTGRFEDLVEVYEIQIRAADEDAARVPLLFKLAELLADQLGDVEAAIERLRAILSIAPGYLPALKLVSSLYMRQHRWADLIAMYEAELTEQQDRDQAIFLLEKIGSISENELGDVDQAIRAYRRMLEWIPGYLPALRSLGRLYAKTERWTDLLAINDEESQIVGDQNHVVSLLHRNGEIYAEKLDDVERAIECFQKALTLLPNYLPALKALGAIYARSGRFEDLLAMHRQEAEVARTAEQRAHLLFQIAQIAHDKIGDPKRASAAYMELLDERPGYYPAIRELARIAERANEPATLVEVYKKEVAVLKDARDRAVMRCRAAEVLDRQLDRLDDAIAEVEAAAEEAPGLLLAHQRLISYLARQSDAKGEARARERMQTVLPDEGSMIANLRALADLHFYSLDDPEKARSAAERLLALAPDDRDALRMAIACALRLKDYRLAITHAEALADVDPSADEVATLHLQVASWKEGHLDPPQDALRNYVRVLEFDPYNPVALRAVEQAYVTREAWDGLFALYEREREGTRDPVRVADLSMKMGTLAERRLGDVERASREYEAVLRAMPTHVAAIARLKELYGASGSPDQKLRMLALEAQASRDPASAVKTLLEVGALQRDQFQNVDAAIDAFYQVLAREPLHVEAFEALQALLVQHSRPGLLVDVHLGRARARSTDAARVDDLFQAANLLVDTLRRLEEGAAIYQQILAIDPRHALALAHLGELRFRHGQWDQAIESFTALVDATTDAALLAPAHVRLGIIFVEHRQDPARAIAHLEKARDLTPDDRDVRRRLADAYARSGDAARAIEERQRVLAAAASREEALAERLALAALFEQGQGEPGRAAAELVAAIELSPTEDAQREIYTRVADLYARAGDLQGYVAFAERQAQGMAARDPRRAADVLARAAAIATSDLKDADLTIRLARRALELAPDHVDVRALLADALSSSPGQGMAAIEEHRRVLRQGALRRASIRALFRAWQSQRAYDRAFCAAEVLCFLKGASEDEELYFGENRTRVKKDTEEALTLAELTGWVVHPDERNVVHEILALCAPDLAKLEPADLSEFEVDKKDILGRRSDDALRRTLIDPIARALDAPPFDVWRTRKKGSVVEAYNGNPMILLVGSEIARVHLAREQRFLVGRKLMALRSGHTLLTGLDAERAKTLLSAIGRAVDKSFVALVERADLDVITKRVSGALSRATKRALVEPVGQLQTVGNQIDFAAFLAALPMTEARAGLVASCDLSAAITLVSRDRGLRFAPDVDSATVIARDPVLADLVSFALSDDYFQARQALRFAIDA